MAVYTLMEIMKGNNDLAQYYKKAQKLWNEIKKSEKFDTIELLAEELSDKQLDFERCANDKNTGQEIMVIVGIGQFYDKYEGFSQTLNDAQKVKAAFDQSYCSLEVKAYADEIAELFGLSEIDEL